MIAFSAFVGKVKDIVFPDLEPENLAFPHRNYIINALIIAQTHIQCLRTSNVNFYTKENAIDSCNVSAITVPPHAVIQAVYAFKPCLGCTRHFFRATSTNEIVCYANARAKCACTTEADICNEANYGDQFCNLYFGGDTAEPDSDFLCSDMMFAKGANDQLYLAPRFPCGYQVGFHWSGVKRTYEDTDAIDDAQDLIDLAALYLEGERALRIDRDFPKYERIMGNGRDARGGGAFWFRFTDTDFRCREEVRVSRVVTCHSLDDTSAFEHFLPTPLPERPPCVTCLPLLLSIGPSAGSGVLVPFSVTLSTNRTATIYYTLDGSAPTTASTKYTAAFTLTDLATTVRAIAYDATDCPSNTVTATWISNCVSPVVTFDPVSGSGLFLLYLPGPSGSTGLVDMSTINGADIYYTLDGADPTLTSALYNSSTPVVVSVGQTLKALAYISPTCFGPIASATYVELCPTSEMYINSTPNPGSVTANPTNVTLSAYAGAPIRYTLDNTDPTATSTLYSGAISITPGVTVLKARMYLTATCFSPVYTFTWLASCQVPTLTFTPPTATAVVYNTTVTITSSLPGFNIYYTTNGAVPTAADTLYTVPISVTAATTLKAKAFNQGDAACVSATYTATYTLGCDNPAVTFNPANGSAIQFPSYVTMTSPSGTTIRYTIDGSEPTTSSLLYSAPLTVTSASAIIKAIAVRSASCYGPVYQAQYSVGSAFEFKYMCDTPDYAGTFEPNGEGTTFGPNGETDYHWMLSFVLTVPREIAAIEIYETASTGVWQNGAPPNGQAWATRSPINPVEGPANFSVYPMVIFENQVQKFTAYQTTLGTFAAGAHVFEMYGDIRTPLTGFFKIIVFYGDGTRTEQVIPHTCVEVSPGFGSTPTCPAGLANTYSISGYAADFFTGLCGGGVDTQTMYAGLLEGSPCIWSGAGLMSAAYAGASNAGQNVKLLVTSRGWTLSLFGVFGGDPIENGNWYKSGGLTPVGTYYLLDNFCGTIGPATLSIA